MKLSNLLLLGAILPLGSGCSSSSTKMIPAPAGARVEVDSLRSSRVLKQGSGKVYFQVSGDDRFLERNQRVRRETWIEVETEDGERSGRSVLDVINTGPRFAYPSDPALMAVSLERDENGIWIQEPSSNGRTPVKRGHHYTITACVDYRQLGGPVNVWGDLRSVPFPVTVR
jgi:hypothetical protein